MGVQAILNFKASQEKKFFLLSFLIMKLKNCFFIKNQWNCDLNSSFFLLNSKSLKSNRILVGVFKLIRKINLDFKIIPIFKRKFINNHLAFNSPPKYITESKIIMKKEIFYEKKIHFVFKSFELSSILYPLKSIKRKFPLQFHCAAQKIFILQSLNSEIIQSGKIRIFCNKNTDEYRKAVMDLLKKEVSKDMELECKLNKKRIKYGNKTLFKTKYMPDKRQRKIIVSARLTVNFFFHIFQKKKNCNNEYKSCVLKSKTISKSILTNVFSSVEFN